MRHPSPTPWSRLPEGRAESSTEVAAELVRLDPDRKLSWRRVPSRRWRAGGWLAGICFALLLAAVACGGIHDSGPTDDMPVQVGRGSTVGTVAAAEGGLLRVRGIDGDSTAIHTNDDTRVFLLGGDTVSDVVPGTLVFVRGFEYTDGSMLAEMIIGTSMRLPDFRFPDPPGAR